MTQARVGWRAYVSPAGGGTGTDTDAQAFITAAAITDSVQVSALNTLVTDLKTYGLWTKIKALYPFVGGSAASHKFNLKDSRDLDAAYRLVFNGGWIHSYTGAKPNGTTGYADTKLVPSSVLSLNSTHVSYYSRTNNMLDGIDFGVSNAAFTNQLYSYIKAVDGKTYFRINRGGTTESNIAIADSRLFYMINRNSPTQEVLFTNTTKNIFNYNSTGLSNYSIFLGSTNLAGTPNYYGNKESAFVSIGDGLTDTEAANFYTSVQKFQTTLGRHVGTPYVSDADAVAFLMAAGITDGTQAAAINTLVIRMKADGVWTKMKAIYPFVGGTAASHKWNLKDPRDLDAAYRLVFSGGWVHTSTGALPNASNTYADTKLIPNSVLTLNSTHLSFYSRTDSAIGGADFGASLTNPAMNMFTKWTDNNAYHDHYSSGSDRLTFSMSGISTSAFFISTRTSNTSLKVYRNGNQIGVTTVNQNVNSLPTSSIWISAHNSNGSYSRPSNRETSFATIGDGLTDTDALNFYTAVQAYQTTLGRQVNVPLVSDTDAQSFLNAANITSFQQASAVNKLVVDLKAAGVWTKMKAIYPFVGGSATSHKFNLKDPRDLDAAYRLVFNGGWTHTSTGAKPNGSNTYANTYFNPTVQSLSTTSQHLSYYSRTNIIENAIEIGAISSTNVNFLGLYVSSTSGTRAGLASSVRYNNSVVVDTRGLFIASRTDTSNIKVHVNGSTQASQSVPSTDNDNFSIYIGAYGALTPDLFSSKEATFASIGDGLTDAEATSLYTAVQTYQTALGRSVNTPVYNNSLVLNLDAGNANSYPGTGTTWFDLASGNNGTLVNGPTYDATNGGSLLFDGINDRISTFGTQFPNNGSKTIDVWFKTTSTVRQGLCGTRDGASTGWVFTINRTTSGRLTYFNTGSGTAEFAAGITTNTWYNAVATHDSTTGLVKIYLNGSLIGSTNVGVIYSSTFNGVIGDEDSAVPSTPFKGNIPKVTIYNKVLTDTEILNNFNSTRGRFGL
jgi:hypothetical protein